MGLVNFEELYQAQFKPLQDAYPLNSEVFSNGKVYIVVDYGFEGTKPHLVGIDREGKEMTLLQYEAVTYKVCTRCKGAGHYSFNLRDGSVCYGCSGVGKSIIAPAGLPKKIALTCTEAWGRFYYEVGDQLNGVFCGFSKTGGTPLYKCTSQKYGTSRELMYNNIIKHFLVKELKR